MWWKLCVTLNCNNGDAHWTLPLFAHTLPYIVFFYSLTPFRSFSIFDICAMTIVAWMRPKILNVSCMLMNMISASLCVNKKSKEGALQVTQQKLIFYSEGKCWVPQSDCGQAIRLWFSIVPRSKKSSRVFWYQSKRLPWVCNLFLAAAMLMMIMFKVDKKMRMTVIIRDVIWMKASSKGFLSHLTLEYNDDNDDNDDYDDHDDGDDIYIMMKFRHVFAYFAFPLPSCWYICYS